MPSSMKFSVVLRAVEFADGEPCPFAGQFLKSFDFDAYGGEGFGEFTDKLKEAKRFEDTEAALQFWRTPSTVKPYRDDGEPNCPLTCTTVEIVRLKE